MEDSNIIYREEYYYRDSIIFSVLLSIYPILDTIKKYPDATYEKFKTTLKISGGALHNRLKDAKIMMLYTNGHGKRLTNLGNQWLNESLKNKGLPSKETIRIACLNVPLFKSLYTDDKELVSANKIFEYFKKHDVENSFNDKFISMAVKRYLEGIHTINIQRKPRLKLYKRQNSLSDFNYDIIPTTQGNMGFQISEYIALQKQLKDLKEKYGKDNLKQILEIL